MHIYLQGLTMGLAYVAPIGLQNLFVINSALTQKRTRVYLTALIVILWDVSLGIACFLGAGALMEALPWLQKVILGLGSLIVIWIGVGLLRSKASLGGRQGRERASLASVHHRLCGDLDESPGPHRRHHDAGGLPGQPAQGGDLPFIFGFGSASVLWFLTLSTVVSLLGGRFNEKVLSIINKVCGAVIIFYGCKLLWSFVKLMGWL